MKNFSVLIFVVLFFTSSLHAQSTYTLNSNTTGWTGADLSHFTLTSGTGAGPITYIIPDGFTLTTLFNGAMVFPCDPTFQVNGTFTYTGDSNCSMTVIADGTSDGASIFVMGLSSSINNLEISYVNVTASKGAMYGAVNGNLSVYTNAGTTVSKVSNLSVGGSASFSLAGGSISQGSNVSSKLVANLSGGNFSFDKTAASFSSNVTSGTLDLKGTITTSAFLSASLAGKIKSSATFSSKVSANIGDNAELDLDGAIFNGATIMSGTSTSKLRLNAGTKFNSSLRAVVGADSEMEVNGVVDVSGKGDFDISGILTSKGELNLLDNDSEVELLTGATLSLPLSSSKLKIGAVEKSGVESLAGPLMLREVSLPVELMSFEGRVVDCKVMINWEVAMEESFDRYELERSKDGVQYEMITRIYGSNDQNLSYQYFDEDASTKNYYRLKMIDLDESFEYADVVFVDASCDESATDWSVFPNPVSMENTMLNVKFYSNDRTIQLEVSNYLGQVVKTMDVSVELGWNTIQADLNGLISGPYYIRNPKKPNGKAYRFMVQ